MSDDILLRSSDRACFFGRTGSGKTTLARALLRLSHRYVVLDPKHSYRSGDTRIVRAFNKRLPRQIIRAQFENEQSHWNAAIDGVWKDGNRILYVDELTLINPSTRVYPILGKAIRTGRERNVGVWCGSQRPKDIPSAVFTEAEHFFIFSLQYEDDRRKVVSFTHDALGDIIKELKEYQFAYYNVRTGQYQIRKLQLRRKGRAITRT